MKVLEIDYDKYIYPEGVSTPEEFADYLLSNTGKFIAMRYYTTTIHNLRVRARSTKKKIKSRTKYHLTK